MHAGYVFFDCPKTIKGHAIKENRPDYIVQNPVHNQSRNHDRCLEIPSYNTEQYKQSFFPRTIIAWNKLNTSMPVPSKPSSRLWQWPGADEEHLRRAPNPVAIYVRQLTQLCDVKHFENFEDGAKKSAGPSTWNDKPACCIAIQSCPMSVFSDNLTVWSHQTVASITSVFYCTSEETAFLWI